MKGLSLLIESAQNLPFLGFYQQPQAYCIVKYNSQRHVTPISKIGKNPYWMFQTQLNLLLQLNKEGQQINHNNLIEIYIYNSNSNAQDELLGWLHIYPQQLNFITLTKTKFQLINLNGNRIQSFIYISSKSLPHIQTDYFAQKQSIKIQILNHVQIQKQDFTTINLQNILVKFLYGDYMTGIKYGQENHVIVPYKNIDQLIISLEGIENVKNQQSLTQIFNIKNLKQKKPQYYKLRYYDAIFPHINYVVCLVFTIIPNSNLPVDYNWLQLTLGTDIKQNFIIRFYSPLQTAIMTSIGIPKMLKIMNSQSTITFEYFECQRMQEKQLYKQKDEQKIIKTIAKYKPQQLKTIKANQLQWTSTQRSDYIWSIKKQKFNKNINIQFQAFKQPKTIIKQIYPTNFITNTFQKYIKITHIKISSCYFYQLLPQQSQLYIYYVDFYANVYHFGSFIIKPNQSQYIIQSRMKLVNQGGWLVVVCHQFKLKQLNAQDQKDKQQNKDKKQYNIITNQQFLDNHMIFKIKTQKQKEIMTGKAIYNSSFLSFAKKVSLTKLCKKFQQAVHNDALIVQPKYQTSVPFKYGLLEVVNCQYIGFQSFNAVQLTAGSDTKSCEGFGSDYLCQQTLFFYISNQKIKLKMTTGKNQLTAHYSFGQIFGYPDNTENQIKTYTLQIQLKGGKLKIWFKFTPLDDRKQTQQPINLLGQENLNRHSIRMPIKIGLKQFKILKKTDKSILVIKKQEQLSMKIRMNQKDCHYESVVQKSATGTFCFNPKKDYIETRSSDNEDGRYIFISVQISSVKGEDRKQKIQLQGEQQQKQQNYYNAAIDIYKVLGKGVIEIKLYDSKTNKLEIIGQVQVLNENILRKQLFQNISVSNPSLLMKIEQLRLINMLSYLSKCDSYEKSLLKNVYNYCIVIFVDGFYYSMITLDSNSKYCQQSILRVKQVYNNDKILIDSRLCVEIKICSSIKKLQGKQVNDRLLQMNSKQYQLSRDMFMDLIQKLQIQIIGQSQINMSDINIVKQDKNKLFIQMKIEFLGYRQLYAKYTTGQINILRQSINFIIRCQLITNQLATKQNKLTSNKIKTNQITSNKKQNNNQITCNNKIKVKNIQLSILEHCIGLIKIISIIPTNTSYLKQLINNQIQLTINSTSIYINSPLNLFYHQYPILISKCQLQFIITNKFNPNQIINIINLPSYLKTNQSLSNSIPIGNFIIYYHIQCFSNTLTTFSQGILTLKDISFTNAKVDTIKIYLPNQQNQSQNVFFHPFQKSIPNNMTLINQSISIDKKMKKLLKSSIIFQVLTQNPTKKMFKKVYLSKISLSSSIQNSKTIFMNQIQCLNDRKTLSICITGEYMVQNMYKTRQKSTLLKYMILGQKQKQLQIPSNMLNMTNNNKQNIGSNNNLIPSRQNGVKLQLQIPQKLIQYMMQNNQQYLLSQIRINGYVRGQQLILIRSKQKSNIYYKYLDRLVDIRQIRFNDNIVKRKQNRLKIQMLNINKIINSTKPINKFIINENPQFILSITQSSYLIPKSIKYLQQNNNNKNNKNNINNKKQNNNNKNNINNKKQNNNNKNNINKNNNNNNKQIQRQSLIIQIQIHKLLSQIIYQKLTINNQQQINESNISSQQKRLLSLKTSPNDQILTNKYCLYFKHGQQQQIIYGIDLQGNITNNSSININKNKILFGYDAQDDQIDIFLCVQQFWNQLLIKQQSNNQFMIQNYSYHQIQKQWISIMPLCHYLIKIFDIKNNHLPFNAIMKPFNYSLTQTSLAKQLYQRFDLKNVAVFGLIRFSQGNWGNLTIKINRLGPLRFKSQQQINNNKVLCYMRICIEYKKLIIKQINTQAREWIQGGYVQYRTFLNYLYLQQINQSSSKYVRFEMFVISQQLTSKIFQKRYPLQDLISSQLNNQIVNINITQNDTNQLTDYMQMGLLFTNTKYLQKSNVFSLNQFNQQQLIHVSNQNVNQVDMISYKDKSFIDVLKIILSTKQITHFIGYIKQLKQSFIYQHITFDHQNSPYAILVILLPYLMTNSIFCFVDILEMLQMAIVKNPAIIQKLDHLSIQTNKSFIYNLFNSLIDDVNKQQLLTNQLSQKYQIQVDELINSIKQKIKKQQKCNLQNYFTKQIVKKISQCVNNHSNILTAKKEQQKYIDQSIYQLMLTIIQGMIQYSNSLVKLLLFNIRKWIQFVSYKGLQILNKMIVIINKLLLISKESLDDQVVQQLMRVLINRNIQIDIIYQYWIKLRSNLKQQFFNIIIQKYYLLNNNQQQNKQNMKQKKQFVGNYTQIISNQNNQLLQSKQIKKTKILKLFYNEIKRLTRRNQKSQQQSRVQSQNGSRIKDDNKSQNKSQKNYHILITINPQLIERYKKLFGTIIYTQNVILLNSIYQLIIVWKELLTLGDQNINDFINIGRQYLDKDKKRTSKGGTLSMLNVNKTLLFNTNNLGINNNNDIQNNNKEQLSTSILLQKNKTTILQNMIKQLTGKDKINIKIKPKNQHQKQSQGFNQYSKYLITK